MSSIFGSCPPEPCAEISARAPASCTHPSAPLPRCSQACLPTCFGAGATFPPPRTPAAATAHGGPRALCTARALCPAPRPRSARANGWLPHSDCECHLPLYLFCLPGLAGKLLAQAHQEALPGQCAVRCARAPLPTAHYPPRTNNPHATHNIPRATLGRLCCLSIIVATFCLWLMWLCTWLHQWHPLIVPTLPSAGHGPAPAEGGSGGGHRR